MKEFMLLFRQPPYDYSKASPAEMQEMAKKWKSWVSHIESQGKLVQTGLRLDLAGKVLKPGGIVTDGPFVEIRERLLSFCVIRGENIDDAVTLAHGCPVLEVSGSVEVREIISR